MHLQTSTKSLDRISTAALLHWSKRIDLEVGICMHGRPDEKMLDRQDAAKREKRAASMQRRHQRKEGKKLEEATANHE